MGVGIAHPRQSSVHKYYHMIVFMSMGNRRKAKLAFVEDSPYGTAGNLSRSYGEKTTLCDFPGAQMVRE